MADTNWLKQTSDEPLFADLIWSRPENRRQAGKLLIIGGNQHGFAAPAAAYNAALKAGVGSVRVLLPEKLKRTVGTLLEADYAPSNVSGSFARAALDSFLEHAAWADGVLLAGNFGRNSETAVVLDSFSEKYPGQLVVAGDALDYFLNRGSKLTARENTYLIINLGKLQKLATNLHSDIMIRHQDSLAEFVRKLSGLSVTSHSGIIVRHETHLAAAYRGKVGTTQWDEDLRWQTELPAYAAVWLLQQSGKPFEAMMSAIYCFIAESH